MKIEYRGKLCDFCHIEDKYVYESMFFIYNLSLNFSSYKLQILPKNYLSYFVNKLTYHHLSPNIHAIFFSLYIAFAILLIIFQFKKQSFFSKIWQGLLVLYFLIYLILLTSATINFGLYSFLIACMFFKFSFKKLLHYVIFFGLLITATAITGYLLILKYKNTRNMKYYH